MDIEKTVIDNRISRGKKMKIDFQMKIVLKANAIEKSWINNSLEA